MTTAVPGIQLKISVLPPSTPQDVPGRLVGASQPSTGAFERPEVRGKFLFVGNQKYWVKGVTYGTFRPNDEGAQFPDRNRVEQDFAQMADAGINSVRVYTAPPRWLLDVALQHGLKVMVGLPWAQHVAFLDQRGLADDIVRSIRADVKSVAGHPAILCFAVGNEIPASIVRWTGARRVERFIRRLYDVVKKEDPTALVTYVNFPTTEYLRLPFLDLMCANVYLESRDKLEGYLARLQNIAGEKPLLMAEIGLDSLRNGDEQQATSLDWQVSAAFASGAVGTFVFAWTDEWYRGGHEIDDWDFGLTTRDRAPKPALHAVSRAFSNAPFPIDTSWPRVSVVVCTYNGSRTIRDTLEALQTLEYPNFEVLVVDDGSTDGVAQIIGEYGVQLIRTENRGLSAARNTGWQKAKGEIVAYIDDDAYPDPHWLHFIAYRFLHSDCVGVGGPNIAPPGDGWIAECVGNAPGGPVHVLVTDTEAEHIPGCNMAFRRSALADIGGFDPRFRTAGDDVDLCWRLLDGGGKIGFHAGAMDWHHRRNSLGMYWRQQKGYGKAEALLEDKWPERYNSAGHVCWTGRLYGKGLTEALRVQRSRIYQGTWGSAAYQSVYKPEADTLLSMPLMPEWNLLIVFLAVLSVIGVFWPPLLYVALSLLAVAMVVPLAQAMIAAAEATFPTKDGRWSLRMLKRAVTCMLHLVQPVARLVGRLQHGLTPWRRRGLQAKSGRLWLDCTLWSEEWRAPEEWVQALETALGSSGAIVSRGGDYDGWDLRVRGGILGSSRGTLAVEEHGEGKQLIRLRARPWFPLLVPVTVVFGEILVMMASMDGNIAAASMVGSLTVVFFAGALWESAIAAGALLQAKDALEGQTASVR